MKLTNRGVTLYELLAYLAIVGIVVTLLTGTFSYAVRSYDQINGQGAIINEANSVMSLLITQANVFNPQYIRNCGENCVELVIDKEKMIDSNLGLIKEVPVNKTSRIRLVDHNIYIGNMQLNNSPFGIDPTNTKITYTCYDENKDNTICQKFVLTFRLAIVRVNKEGEILSPKPYIFENRFSF